MAKSLNGMQFSGEVGLDAVILGAAAVDMVAKVPQMPERDGIVLANSFEQYPGGSGANIAANLARMGYSAGFIGKVGDDESGRLLERSFEEAGVDLRHLLVEQQGNSARCFIAIDSQGDRVIYALGGKALIEKPDELDEQYIQRARLLCITDAFPEVAEAAAAIAHSSGRKVLFCPGGVMVSNGMQILQPVLCHTDMLLLSRSEAFELSGINDLKAAVKMLRSSGAKIVVVTLGAGGCLLSWDDEWVHIPGTDPEAVVDTTGAGDAFAAGWIAGFLDNLDWRTCARLGCAVAGLKIGHVGAREGIPAKEEMDKLIRSIGKDYL